MSAADADDHARRGEVAGFYDRRGRLMAVDGDHRASEKLGRVGALGEIGEDVDAGRLLDAGASRRERAEDRAGDAGRKLRGDRLPDEAQRRSARA